MSEVPLKRVLVADEDEIILALVRHILTRQGYSVDVAANATLLDELTSLHSYAAIMVDIGLAGDAWLRALPPDNRVIAIVSNGDGHSLPVKATIRKPLELDALAEIVDACSA